MSDSESEGLAGIGSPASPGAHSGGLLSLAASDDDEDGHAPIATGNPLLPASISCVYLYSHVYDVLYVYVYLYYIICICNVLYMYCIYTIYIYIICICKCIVYKYHVYVYYICKLRLYYM